MPIQDYKKSLVEFSEFYNNSKKVVLEILPYDKYGNKYLDKAKDYFFPTVRQVAARTIGMDLVSVQPMSAPVGNLMFMDFQYKSDSKNENIIVGNLPEPRYVGTMT